MKLEVIDVPAQDVERDTILFIHGACHGAWCWEHFQTFFAKHGYRSIALSFRGHGKSEGRDDLDSFGFEEYVEDVRQTAEGLPNKPIVVAHSMGGVVLQRYLGQHPDSVKQAVMLCAMLPDGTSASYQLKLMAKHFRGTKVMLDINSGKHLSASKLKDAVVFSGRLSEADVAPYVSLIQPESKRAMNDQTMPATNNYDVSAPVHVIGATGDWMFPDQSANAAKYGSKALMLEGMCHDVMLDPDWERAAGAVLRCIES